MSSKQIKCTHANRAIVLVILFRQQNPISVYYTSISLFIISITTNGHCSLYLGVRQLTHLTAVSQPDAKLLWCSERPE